MKCYVCEKMGIDREASGVCIVCGMGLCSEHMVRSDVETFEGGYPFPSRKLKKPIPRILCPECAAAFGGR
ncbi:MAG: DUF2180 family protein [Methanocorpusculum sp.]|nr:DUF2180 family protein [Methanocorpusculum parvum]MBQ2771795.1 DUF2180 family protein [Methanocorpusculum sp.]MBQ4134013.1 DUF2180 family protein [Methanocorpusculum sp.]MBR4117745.1 DUF2180 family protein [Methanocorpusculum sp.]HJJ64649.1 DUF2180 family protein [Methanocorpusculum sp.]